MFQGGDEVSKTLCEEFDSLTACFLLRMFGVIVAQENDFSQYIKNVMKLQKDRGALI